MLDVNLPKYNGDAVLRHVRRQPWLQGVPVIMLTSSASPADRAAAIDLGANLYLQKSSDLDELLEVGKIVEAILAVRRVTMVDTAQVMSGLSLTHTNFYSPPERTRRIVSCCNR